MNIFEIAKSVKDEKDPKGKGKDFPLPRAGVALFRLCSVLELGIVESEWAGKKKLNKKVIVEFELVHPDHKIVDQEGRFIGYHRVTVYLNKSGFEKSKYMKLFHKLNYDGAVHVEKDHIPPFSRFLGKPFYGMIHHVKSKDGSRMYVNLNKGDDYTIGAPRIEVMDSTGLPTGKFKTIQVPDMHIKPRLFLWEAAVSDEAYQMMWDSIYSERNNWIQNAILSEENVGLPGSRAEQLFKNNISGLDAAFSGSVETVEADIIDDVPWGTSEVTDADMVNDVQVDPEPEPEPVKKPRRKRRTKAEMEAARAAEAEAPKPRRKRRTKAEMEAARKAEAERVAAPDEDDDPLAALGL